MGKAWTVEEDVILLDKDKTIDDLMQELPGRTMHAIYKRCSRLGVQRQESRQWTKEELKILRELYPTFGVDGVYARLTGRPRGSIAVQASKLGLKYTGANASGKRFTSWSSAEIEILRENSSLDMTSLMKLLPGRSSCAIKNQLRRFATDVGVRVHWTEKEDAILRKYYVSEGSAVVDRLGRHTLGSTLHRAHQLGLVRDFNLPWTDEEDSVLKEFYCKERGNVSKRLSGRSAYACLKRAKALGIKVHNAHWTAEEDAILSKHLLEDGEKIVDRLPGRSFGACIARGRKLGVWSGNRDSRHWTRKELRILLKYYAEEGGTVCSRLPERSTIAIRAKASRMGIANHSSCRG